ncbi:MAG TPA: FAD-dependent monooxygenase [Chthoniobacterales bacterium]|jgi:2-polyprenyl-6-methoxyphenol hydroxylase-like FAD-dependent oxidoreductase|nr:FAD-dependent monooxygenase [Chthoniobacterales bacterium]
MTPDASAPLVVGAGPVGLTIANELARHGVRCRIIERAAERSQTSKALAIFPRTLEVFETMGVVDRFLAAGHRLHGLSLHHREEQIAQIELTSVASPFPFALGLPQSETERLLEEHLSELGIEVERSLELKSFTQATESVRATLRRSDGEEETIETPWLIGCDGAHSTTRHTLGMHFEGAAYDESFILADVQLAVSLTRDRVHLFLGGDGILGLIPFGKNLWRIVANIPPESRDLTLPEVTLAEVQKLIERRVGPELQASAPVWLSRFHISHRKVRQFRQLRVFLAGDSAHIHSPAGGQGMNTGIQDAFNLGWKLAAVVRGIAPAQLLASYHIERDPVAKGVLNLTDRITRMATMRNAIAQNVRDFLLPVVSGIDFVGDKIADRLTELSVNYRQSPIVENHGPGRLKAGDRAPDAELRDRNNQARRLFELFREPRHVLLIFLGATAKAELGALRPERIDVYRIARGESELAADLRDLSGLAHAAYDLYEGGIVVVRPDGYIGYRSPDFDPVKLQAYLVRIFLPAPGSAS